jgi:O-antigen/teichoic acid export membrane protein
LNQYKQLAGQTAIYGLSSIIGRFLNVLLVPIYTRVFEVGEYGIVTQLYAYVAFFNILFIYGLDTAFFRFFQSEKGNEKVYSTSLVSILATSVIFTLIIFLLSDQIAGGILSGVSNGSLYVKLFAGVLACDAITAIPFAKLRQENKAKRFAFLRLVNIAINLGLNLFFLLLCPALIKSGSFSWISSIYDPTLGVGYVFICNLVASFVTMIMMAPEILRRPLKFDHTLWKQMMVYAFPLMIAGFAGMINETFDRILIPVLIREKSDAMVQLGIYGACYKLSIIMTLFIQTYRYAAEPFFFNHSTKENPQEVYAVVMNYFVITCSFIFLGVMLYIDIVKVFIGPDFRSGLGVVPILLMANLCLGVYYNLSIWYKLTSKTAWGAWLSVFGAAVTLLFNILLIPLMGYMGAAWATLFCYALMMISSYFIGQKHYPVPYKITSFLYYVLLAILFWRMSLFINRQFDFSSKATYVVNTIILILFSAIVFITERRKNNYLRATK